MLWYLRDKYDKYWITSADCNNSNRILSLLTLRASSGLWRTLKDSLNSWEESLSGQLWVATILFSRSTIFLNGKTNILFCKKVNSFQNNQPKQIYLSQYRRGREEPLVEREAGRSRAPPLLLEPVLGGLHFPGAVRWQFPDDGRQWVKFSSSWPQRSLNWLSKEGLGCYIGGRSVWVKLQGRKWKEKVKVLHNPQ